MLEASEFGPIDPKNPAALAARYFIIASKNRAACVPAQAALIAIWCKQDGQVSPKKLGKALVKDKSQLERLTQVAQVIHEVLLDRPVEIDYQITRAIIRHDFRLADQLMVLKPDELEFITTTLYEKYKKRPGERPHNIEYEEEALAMARTRRPSLLFRLKNRILTFKNRL